MDCRGRLGGNRSGGGYDVAERVSIISGGTRRGRGHEGREQEAVAKKRRKRNTIVDER